MNTRGIVAVGTPAHWNGVYNHFDSYREGLGKELKEMAESMSLAEMARLVKTNRQGFSSFPSAYSSFPSAYPKDEEDITFSSDTMTKSDWLDMEYVYIIDVDAGKIWWGHHYFESSDPHKDYEAGPPKEWHVLYSAEKRKKK